MSDMPTIGRPPGSPPPVEMPTAEQPPGPPPAPMPGIEWRSPLKIVSTEICDCEHYEPAQHDGGPCICRHSHGDHPVCGPCAGLIRKGQPL